MPLDTRVTCNADIAKEKWGEKVDVTDGQAEIAPAAAKKLGLLKGFQGLPVQNNLAPC